MIVPPIKSQGIKTKLISWINNLIFMSDIQKDMRWIEPFFGTGVVGFNSPMIGEHIVGDINPYIIGFYQSVQNRIITADSMRNYLERESLLLSEGGYSYFLEVRNRFNCSHSIYDFIFLSRSGFNGMMRFNSRGEWNVPFCKKANRFSKSYITKICNQVENVSQVIHSNKWKFCNINFSEMIANATPKDFIYCDPPYYGRNTDYFNTWTENDELILFKMLKETSAKFILSTWHHNDYRENEMLKRFWNEFNVVTKEHFYYNGGKLENRHSVVEALIFNFEVKNCSNCDLN